MNTGRTGYFEKGNISYNKGRKGICAEGCKKTWFKKGHIPKNYRPIGSERITKDGYIEVKIADPNKWKLKHRVIWEQAKGKVPHGYAIIFKDGNKLNTDIDNLMLVSRKVLAVMNKSGLYKNGYKEIAALIAELNVKVGEKKKGCEK